MKLQSDFQVYTKLNRFIHIYEINTLMNTETIWKHI